MNLNSLSTLFFAGLIFTLAPLSSFSQSAQTEMEIIQDAFGLDKKMAVATFMKLGDEAADFWDIYDAYENERKEIGKKRIEVIVQYANSYPAISNEEILDLYEKTEDIKKANAELLDSYFKKMKEEVGLQQAAQFWHLENYFSAVIQVNIYAQLPFIGYEGRE